MIRRLELLLFEEPSLNCEHCYSMRADFMPMCETPGGCSIEELASDPDLQSACDEFLRRRALYFLTQDPAIYADLCERFELRSDDQTHLALEMVFARWQRKLEQDQMDRAATKRLTNA